MLACYSAAINLCSLDVSLLKEALSQRDRGDYFRFFSGFTFAYDWWEAEWGHLSYLKSIDFLKNHFTVDESSEETSMGLLGDLCLIAAVLQTFSMNAENLWSKESKELKALQRTAFNPTKVSNFVLHLNDYVSRQIVQADYGHPPSVASLMPFLSIVSKMANNDTLFNYIAMDAQKGYTAKLTMQILSRLDEFVENKLVPYQLCCFARIIFRFLRENSCITHLLTTPQALSLVESSARKLLEESKKSSYSAADKALLAAMAVTTFSFRICPCVTTVVYLHRPMLISRHEFFNTVLESIAAWNQVLEYIPQTNKAMNDEDVQPFLSAASMFYLSNKLVCELLVGCAVDHPPRYGDLFTIALDESENAIDVLKILSLASNVHNKNITATLTWDQPTLAGNNKFLEYASDTLLQLTGVVNVILKVYTIVVVYKSRLSIYGSNTQAVGDAAWQATIESAKLLVSVSKHPEPFLKTLHTIDGHTGVKACDDYASPFLGPPQNALSMTLITSAMTDAIASDDDQTGERETAAILLVYHALGCCRDKWSTYLDDNPGISLKEFDTLYQSKENLLRSCLMPTDVVGLELAVDTDTDGCAIIHIQANQDGLKLLGELVQVAKEADVKDATRAIARAKILSHLPCSYLGCTTPGTIHGDIGKTRSKLCSGCRTVRYCSSMCQKADWKTHKIACKSIAAAK